MSGSVPPSSHEPVRQSARSSDAVGLVKFNATHLLKGSGNFGGCKQHENLQILVDIVKTMLDHARDIEKGTGADSGSLSAYGELAPALDNVINLVLPVRRLQIPFSPGDAINAGAHRRNTQKFAVLDGAITPDGKPRGNVFEMAFHGLLTETVPR